MQNLPGGRKLGDGSEREPEAPNYSIWNGKIGDVHRRGFGSKRSFQVVIGSDFITLDEIYYADSIVGVEVVDPYKRGGNESTA